MRILHLVPAAPFGGAQRLAVDLAAKQVHGGMNAHLVFLASDEASAGRANRAAQEAGVEAQSLTGSIPAILRQLRDILAAKGIMLVHLHVPPAWILPALPTKRSFGLIAHLHTRPLLKVHAPTLKRRIDAWAIGKIMRRCDRLIAITEWIAAAWTDQDPGLDPVIVYNGVTLPARPLPIRNEDTDRPFTLGMASRLSDRKGVEEFLDLATALTKRDPAMRFIIAGDGPLRAAYEQDVEARGLSDSVTFAGFVEDMAGFWKKLDLAAFTPPFEPFGLRLIEPVVGGVPVIGYRTGTGADEVMALCRGTASVPYADVDALADLAVALSADRDKRAEMVNTGMEDIKRLFSLEVMAANVERVYQENMEAVGMPANVLHKGAPA